jgi:hypothetical protein
MPIFSFPLSHLENFHHLFPKGTNGFVEREEQVFVAANTLATAESEFSATWRQSATTKQNEVEIEFTTVESDLLTGVSTYRGGVTAKMGNLVLRTDTLVVRDTESGPESVQFKDGERTIFLKRKEAYALGKVTIGDQDIEARVESLWFSFDEKLTASNTYERARASNFYTKIDAAWIKADSLSLTGQQWLLTGVAFSTSDKKTPYYLFRAEEVQIQPGKRGTARQASLDLFGSRMPKIPRFSFSLDTRRRVTQLPQISIRRQAGVGVSWGGVFETGPNSQVTANIASFPQLLPSYDVQYSISKVPASQSGFNQLRMQDDFMERSQFSYFGNIYLNSISNPREIMSIKRDLYSVGTAINIGTFGRVTDIQSTYSRLVEFAHESGGKKGDGATFIQTRAQYISEKGGDPVPRLSILGSYATPNPQLGRLSFGARFDVGGFLTNSSHAWFGGEGGASYEANRFWKLSAGAYSYSQIGTPFFRADEYVSNQGFVLRSDISGKATNFSILFRYDPVAGWFDRQYRFTQVVGPIEPVLVYRQNPSFYQIGCNFRIDSVLEVLQRRRSGMAGNQNQPVPMYKL